MELDKLIIRGAKENGHIITEYDLIRKDIRSCSGCNACGMSGPCVYKDDYENTSIPIEELRSPLNEEEAHRRLVRIKADPKYKFIMEMADGGRRNKK